LAEELRLAFGNTAEDYDRGRPGWPDAVAEAGGLPPSAEVLDLGARPEDERLTLAAKLRELIPNATFTLPVRDENHWTRLR
jgi:hypothetical protein